MESKNINHKTYILTKTKKPHIFTNTLSKFILIFVGKRDGKKGIPSNNNNPDWMSPTLRKEHAKIDENMAKVWYDIYEKSGVLYSKTEAIISEFEQNAIEIKRIHDYIIFEGIKYKDVVSNNISNTSLYNMLNTKRDSEQKCDAFGIRLRRYNEYNKAISVAKDQYLKNRIKFKKDYQEIKMNYQIISILEEELDVFFLELCSNIERRTSWYWQGVLLKHPQKASLPQVPPKANNKYINDFHDKRRAKLKVKIDKIERIHEEILKLEYVE